MRRYIEDFIKVLIRKKVLKSIKKVVYKGHIPSLNDLYGSKHWTSRHKAAEAYHLAFKILLKQHIGAPNKNDNKFSLFIFFNSRHDTDNIVGIEKYFTDMLVREGYVSTDNKSYFRSLLIAPDETLKKNTVEFIFATHI